jgi:hypothetical protein
MVWIFPELQIVFMWKIRWTWFIAGSVRRGLRGGAPVLLAGIVRGRSSVGMDLAAASL